MELGIIGLGRMGGSISQRLTRAGHTCVVYDHTASVVQDFAAKGATASTSLADMVQKLHAPRAVWVMLPAGAVTEAMVDKLAGLLSSGATRASPI